MVLDVPSGTAKPYYVIDDNAREKKSYFRYEKETKELSKEQIEKRFNNSVLISTDAFTIQGSEFKNLNKHCIENYFVFIDKSYRVEEWINLKDDDIILFLTNRKILKKDEFTGKLNCTIAGMFLFGNYTHHYIPQSTIRLSRYAGIK